MEVEVFIEIPKGSSIKYEVDEKTGELKVDRFLHTAFSFPFNYGFIKETKGKDNDPLDAVLLASQNIQAGVVIKCQPIGLLEMEDEGGIDTKIIVVPVKKIDPKFGAMQSIKDVPEADLAKIRHFFENYKSLEPDKWVKLQDYKDKAEAEKEIKESKL